MGSMMGQYVKEEQVPVQRSYGWGMQPQYGGMSPWEIFMYDLLRNQGGLLDAYKRSPAPQSMLGTYKGYVDQSKPLVAGGE